MTARVEGDDDVRQIRLPVSLLPSRAGVTEALSCLSLLLRSSLPFDVYGYPEFFTSARGKERDGGSFLVSGDI
jgi:hypothetical protein